MSLLMRLHWLRNGSYGMKFEPTLSCTYYLLARILGSYCHLSGALPGRGVAADAAGVELRPGSAKIQLLKPLHEGVVRQSALAGGTTSPAKMRPKLA